MNTLIELLPLKWIGMLTESPSQDVHFSAVKWLIEINRIQNKGFCLHNICVYTVYIYYVYINKNTCMYIFKKRFIFKVCQKAQYFGTKKMKTSRYQVIVSTGGTEYPANPVLDAWSKS